MIRFVLRRFDFAPVDRIARASRVARAIGMLVCAALLGCAGGLARAADDDADVEALEEAAMRKAVQLVSPAVVRIETVGGLEQIGQGPDKMLVGTGPTTGLVVSSDGYIISSAFNFAQKPTSILIGLPDGSRAPAKLVATDKNRMLSLLKIDVENLGIKSLEPPIAVPDDQVRVGQWAIAVGRTYESETPNMSVGIVSAKNRIWGKAIQTDAKVSPGNYGGPLVDIRGRVLGVLVPLSPQGSTELAGVEWYDSGIGFAVPLSHIYSVLPRMKEGKNLFSGVVGVSFKSRDELSGDTSIGVVRAGSPGADAGLKSGDKIIEVDGKPIERVMQIRQALGPHYAGDVVKIAVLRDGVRIEAEVTLVAELEPYQHPFLGMLAMRDTADGGAVIRYLFPDSPAQAAGLAIGDVITKFGETAIASRDALAGAVHAAKPNQKIAIEYRRGVAMHTAEVTLGAWPTTIPDKLPPAHGEHPAPAEKPETGVLKDRKIAEFNNTYLAYVPDSYRPQIPYGLVVVLHEPGGFKPDEIIDRWKKVCDEQDLILVAPKSSDADRWLPTEVEFIKKMIDETSNTYKIDRHRVVLYGYQGGGTMAYLVSARNRELIHGVIAVDATPFKINPGENEPANRLAFYVSYAKKSNSFKEIEAFVTHLESLKFSVFKHDQGEESPHNLTADELQQVARWIDMLDGI